MASTLKTSTVAMWTVPWVVGLLFLLLLPTLDLPPIPYRAYEWGRVLLAALLLVLVVSGLLVAVHRVRHEKRLFASPFLVSLLIFWAIAPPGWFFIEYLLFDQGQIKLPDGKICGSSDAAAQCQSFLASTKIYADLASKIWAGAAAAIATVFAIAKDRLQATGNGGSTAQTVQPPGA